MLKRRVVLLCRFSKGHIIFLQRRKWRIIFINLCIVSVPHFSFSFFGLCWITEFLCHSLIYWEGEFAGSWIPHLITSYLASVWKIWLLSFLFLKSYMYGKVMITTCTSLDQKLLISFGRGTVLLANVKLEAEAHLYKFPYFTNIFNIRAMHGKWSMHIVNKIMPCGLKKMIIQSTLANLNLLDKGSVIRSSLKQI